MYFYQSPWRMLYRKDSIQTGMTDRTFAAYAGGGLFAIVYLWGVWRLVTPALFWTFVVMTACLGLAAKLGLFDGTLLNRFWQTKDKTVYTPKAYIEQRLKTLTEGWAANDSLAVVNPTNSAETIRIFLSVAGPYRNVYFVQIDTKKFTGKMFGFRNLDNITRNEYQFDTSTSKVTFVRKTGCLTSGETKLAWNVELDEKLRNQEMQVAMNKIDSKLIELMLAHAMR
ncbi:MAG TPA: hypothetical protein VFM68_02530 [Candidatus Saccharimonadales bacterium]|nr:hypothetical protein [Candidatus Saccharimonadales bacterium]